jgi:hypothetical protein
MSYMGYMRFGAGGGIASERSARRRGAPCN